jgi:hypothetical protein
MKKTASQIADEVLIKVSMTDEESERVRIAYARSLGLALGITNLPRLLTNTKGPLVAKVLGAGVGSLVGGGIGYGLGAVLGKYIPEPEETPWYAKSDEAARRMAIGSGLGGGLGMMGGSYLPKVPGLGSALGTSAGSILGGRLAKATMPE